MVQEEELVTENIDSSLTVFLEVIMHELDG